MLSFSDIMNRNLAESKLVPDPSTRVLCNPLNFQATKVIMSTGSVNAKEIQKLARIGEDCKVTRHAWIGGDDEDRVRRMLDKVGDDPFENIRVPLNKVKA